MEAHFYLKYCSVGFDVELTARFGCSRQASFPTPQSVNNEACVPSLYLYYIFIIPYTHQLDLIFNNLGNMSIVGTHDLCSNDHHLLRSTHKSRNHT
mmetsp:Transcript_7792/g.9081  ORF Transcript_7792/g.9081 Transcript_7792/m.9081 type:complete len:96 (-) Transcript_7792:773-1060(-)